MLLKRPAVVIDRAPKSETFVSIVTFVPIARWRNVMGSFKLSNRVEGQIKKSPGIVAYSLATNPLRRHFWTYSIWSDMASARAFTRAEPHATAIERFKDWAGEGSAFVSGNLTTPS